MIKKRKFVIILISLIGIFVFALNGFVMAQPSKQQIHAFRSAKTVRIVVNQSYSMAKGVWLWPENRLVLGESYGIVKGVSLPFEDITKRFLRHAGFRILTGTEG